MNNYTVDYKSEFQNRLDRLKAINSSPKVAFGAIQYYKQNPVEFIKHWCTTYDPRNASSEEKPTTMPFILFPRQEDLINWAMNHISNKSGGAIEKCRDAGATETLTAFSVWAWLFLDGFSIGWGSRKEMLVDRIGDPDSIFEKLRNKIRHLPKFFLPDGFSENEHFNYMKIINPDNGNTITGEAGINIGRGGRKSIYFVDESAHCDKQEAIAAALGDNTNTEIHISSVNGMNLFYKRAKANGGKDTFIFDWRQDPRKDQEWYDKRKQEATDKGLLHIFMQEVERDYAAAVEGIMIRPDWLRACIDAHKKLNFEATGITQYGTDVSDEGGDIDAITGRKGSIVNYIDSWNCAGDHDYSAGKATDIAHSNNADKLIYDSIGVGAGFKTAIKHIENIDCEVIGWNAGGAVINKDDRVYNDDESEEDKRTNKDFFMNAKAQGWWNIRERARKTFMAIENGKEYHPDEMISFDLGALGFEEIESLISELSAPKMKYSNGKVKVESKQEMKDRGIDSPNKADSCIMAFVEADEPESVGLVMPSRFRRR